MSIDSANGQGRQKSILLIEDDAELGALIQVYLITNHYNVSIEPDGLNAVERICSVQADLVILDLMLPNKDGISICREVRHHYHGPILILTASGDSVDHVVGLEVGADDYVQKPVEPRVLLARIRALLRRSHSDDSAPLAADPTTSGNMVFKDLKISETSRTVRLKDQLLELTTPEFDVLVYLAKKAGTIVTRDQIFMHLRNLPYDGQSRFVDITISQIRKKLGPSNENYLKTVRGKGYLFVLDR